MKTVEEFIKKVEASEELRNEMNAVKDNEAAKAFLKKYEVDATVEEFGKALNSNKPEGEIEDDEAEAAAGGWWDFKRYKYEFYCVNSSCAQYNVKYPLWGDIDYMPNNPKCFECGNYLQKGKLVL